MLKKSNKWLLYIAVLALAGCGGSTVVDNDNVDDNVDDNIHNNVDDNSDNSDNSVDEIEVIEPAEPTTPSTPLVSLTTGQEFYNALCTDCHGGSGNGAIGIDISSCEFADCSSIDTLATFINVNMPKANEQACTLGGDDSCAMTTAAYILNDFSTNEDIIPVSESTGVKTPLARLTNYEFVNSVKSILKLADNPPNMVNAESSLATEFVIRGLKNDASTQALSQLGVSGYLTMTTAATNDLLEGVETRGTLNAALGCTAFIENFNQRRNMAECVKAYTQDVMSRAFSRPATEEDVEILDEIFAESLALSTEYGKPDVERFKDIILSSLQYIFLSPDFLLLVENGVTAGENTTVTSTLLTDHEIAKRMALFLSGGLPDDQLLAAADAGLLTDPEVRLHHTNRLMNSDTGIEQFVTIITDWLEIDDNEVSDPESLAAIDEFIANWFFYEGRFSYLYEGPVTVEHTNGSQTSEPFGVLGLKAFLESHTTEPTPSFITRGVFVVEGLLCQALPEDLPDDALNVGIQTPVEVFKVHTKQACATCHVVFDNYGAAFQSFDPETLLYDPSNQDFGTSFDLYDIGDVTSTVSDVGDLGSSMGSSERAANCMGELWYRNAMRRNIDENGQDKTTMDSIIQAWSATSDNSMKSLLRSIVMSDSFITLYY